MALGSNYEDVLKQLHEAGLEVDHLEIGRMRRCKVEGDREKRGWYSLHELRTDSGELLIVGSYGVWRGSDSNTQKVEVRKSQMSADQRAALKARIAEDRKAAEREDPRDAFLSLTADRLEDLPQGARLGTASLRRQAQCLNLRPDLDVRLLRGNVDTRLEKLRAGEADAILLAASGLNRLGLGDIPRSFIDPRLSPPAPGQGALAIQTREADRDAPWLEALRHAPTALAVAAERGAMAALEGSCRTAIGAYAFAEDDDLALVVEALSPDGVHRFRGQARMPVAAGASSAALLGLELGRRIQADGGDLILLAD